MSQNINRAIKRATEAASGDFSESTFEAYGFGGASFVINVLSDNANRATADVKSTVGKNNGKMAESGSVLFLYDRKGKIEVPAVLDEEELLEAAIEAGCEDMELVEVKSYVSFVANRGNKSLLIPVIWRRYALAYRSLMFIGRRRRNKYHLHRSKRSSYDGRCSEVDGARGVQDGSCLRAKGSS